MVSEKKLESENRERVKVGLAHSLVLAKHLEVEKLKAIRQYYDHYQVPFGSIRGKAFKLLKKQAMCSIQNDDDIWKLFHSSPYKIPLFPYRMQAVALWDDATNWRVLQASAHEDIENSLQCWERLQIENEEKVLHNVSCEVNIFDYCSEWTKQTIKSKGSVGVLIETVRSFLAEWTVERTREPVWEPEVPEDYFEFDLGETSIGTVLFYGPYETGIMVPQHRLIWMCQRELQKKVAKMRMKDDNLPGNAALIMLLLSGFPLLSAETVLDTEFWAQEVQETSTSSFSNRQSSVDVDVQLWRVWTVLAPQDISLMCRVDSTKHTVSLRLQNSSGDKRFRWQDWVDAAMGCLKGIEEIENSDYGYGRQIVRTDLRKPVVELCPLRVHGHGIDATVKRTSTARVWTGWPPFDTQICQFELDQWLAACDVNLNGALEEEERRITEDEVSRLERVIEEIASGENAEMDVSIEGDDV